MSILQRNNLARAKGGFRALTTLNKNKFAEVFFRRAIEDELNKFNRTLIRELERAYTPIYSENSKYSTGFDKRKPSRATIEFILNKFKGYNSRLLTKNLKKIVNKYMRRASKEARKTLSDALKKEFGKSFRLQWSKEDYDETLKAMVSRNVALIKNVSDQTISNIESVVYDAMTTGQGWKDIKDSLAHQKEISDKRIKRIARDQTAKTNASLNYLEQQSAGIEYFRWETMKDERVSTGNGGHKQLQGKIYKWGDEKNYPIIDSYGNRGLPATRVNCFTGDTTANVNFGLKNLYRREYSGVINVIKTDTDRFIRATPNHPFFTQRGWVRANDLNSGDYIVNIKPVAFNVNNGNEQEIVFEELFNAFSLFNLITRVGGSGHQFHGDGIIDKDVDIISIDSLLLNNRMTELLKPLCQFRFSESDMGLKTVFFMELGFMFSLGLSKSCSSESIVRLLCEIQSFLLTQSAHSDNICFATCSFVDSLFRKYSIDNISCDIEFLRQSEDTQPISIQRAYFIIGQVIYSIMNPELKFDFSFLKPIENGSSFDAKSLSDFVNSNSRFVFFSKVKQNVKCGFSGHIYNLQSDCGYYTINNGFVNHNCRCVAQPVFLEEGWSMVQNPDGSYTPVKDK